MTIDPTATLGFVGLGDMGGPMAANLARGGARLIVHDKAGTAERAPEGAEVAGSVAELAGRAQAVFVSVPDGAATLSVAREIAGAGDRRAEAMIDLSTIGVEATGPVAAALGDAGVAYADAPVSGGRAGAVAGTITVMWSGPQDLLDALRPRIETFAKSVFFVGAEPGQGQALKLLNNFLSGVAMTATSEAIAFGLSRGLEMKTMLDVLNVSTGRNTATGDKFPNRILTASFDAGFRMPLMQKDVGLYLAEARAAGTPASIGEVVDAYWRAGLAAHPEGDFTEIFKVIAGEDE